MEKLKFISEITSYLLPVNEKQRVIIGDCVYVPLRDGMNVKLYCEARAVIAKVISKRAGVLDCVELPFANYFKPTKVSDSAPEWTQYIDNGKWYFSDTYPRVLPTEEDFACLAAGIDAYIGLYNSLMD